MTVTGLLLLGEEGMITGVPMCGGEAGGGA